VTLSTDMMAGEDITQLTGNDACIRGGWGGGGTVWTFLCQGMSRASGQKSENKNEGYMAAENGGKGWKGGCEGMTEVSSSGEAHLQKKVDRLKGSGKEGVRRRHLRNVNKAHKRRNEP